MPATPLKLIVGLGNPGSEYEQTRHNAGFWFVDQLARRNNVGFKTDPRFHGQIGRFAVAGFDCRLLKPLTFMNRCGQSVAGFAAYFRIAPEEILVAHDELDLPAGVIRLRRGGGGHAGHNGLRDVMSLLGSKNFNRLRIGIDHPADRQQVVGYVLSRPSTPDRDAIVEALSEAEDALPDLLAGEFQRVMNRLHTSR